MSSGVKQVIVMRKKFPDADGNMRKLRTGKMVAQGAHASMKVILDMMKTRRVSVLTDRPGGSYDAIESTLTYRTESVIDEWINGLFTKVCVGVDSEEELLELYDKAKRVNTGGQV